MTTDTLSDFVTAQATEFGIPGVAVAVWADGRENHACHGVTSVDNPLPVDGDTMFAMASVTKSVTATAVMCLVADGRVELDAPVRRYVPELRLADETTAATITVAQLLNHTAGLGLGDILDTGDGDDALTNYVATLPDLALIAPPGTRASYSQAGFNLLGRIIEKVTGMTYERAVASLLFEPLGMTHSYYLFSDLLTRRFAVGHNPDDDGNMTVARLWKRWRGDNPGGGLASSISDLMRWARFHVNDGRADDGTQVLPAGIVGQMRVATVPLRASTLGDAIGIGWFLRDIDGVPTAGHGGSSNGQFAELLIVPERNFAVVALSNAGPNGIPFNQAVVRWALRHYLGLTIEDPKPLPYDDARAHELIGRYEIDAMLLTVIADGEQMLLDCRIRPEIRAAATTELPPDYDPADIGLLPGDGDEYVITEGGLAGQRGFFTRAEDGTITGIDVAGRLFTRVISG